MKGLVRIRSNVSDHRDWNLVPGDEMRRHKLHYDGLTQKQHDEMMYYEPCAKCQRTVYDIYEFGCDCARCQVNGVVSAKEATLRRERYSDSGDDM